jgi:hypothetical protein
VNGGRRLCVVWAGASGTLQGKPALLPAGQNDAGGQGAQTCKAVTRMSDGRGGGGQAAAGGSLQGRQRRCSWRLCRQRRVWARDYPTGSTRPQDRVCRWWSLRYWRLQRDRRHKRRGQRARGWGEEEGVRRREVKARGWGKPTRKDIPAGTTRWGSRWCHDRREPKRAQSSSTCHTAIASCRR